MLDMCVKLLKAERGMIRDGLRAAVARILVRTSALRCVGGWRFLSCEAVQRRSEFPPLAKFLFSIRYVAAGVPMARELIAQCGVVLKKALSVGGARPLGDRGHVVPNAL